MKYVTTRIFVKIVILYKLTLYSILFATVLDCKKPSADTLFIQTDFYFIANSFIQT